MRVRCVTGGMLKGLLRLTAASAGCDAQDGGYHVPYAHATLAAGLDMPSYRRQGSPLALAACAHACCNAPHAPHVWHLKGNCFRGAIGP